MTSIPATDPHHVVGSLGSDFWRIRVPSLLVPELARKIDWNRMGRRVMIDAVKGVIVWMSPSSTHEGLAAASEDVVSFAAARLTLKVDKKRGTRWRAPDDPKDVGLEADAAFYIGERAVAYYATLKQEGQAAAARFTDTTPPDLVVEVEVTHFDQDKPERYARLGVREMWRVDARKGTDYPQVDILSLQDPTGPTVVAFSSVLAGLASSILPQAFWLASVGEHTDLSALLNDHLIKGKDLSAESDEKSS
ncbi:MAG: Uma2 family endonuclease [Aestuariivita sp.]|nr:Uma2 family endonuclease [Aestuariivita sp.]